MSGGDAELPSGQVALLFTDIQGSTALLGRLGEAYGDVLDEHDHIMRSAFATHGGHEFSNEGDAFGAAFASAESAAEAALEVQRRLAEASWPGEERIRVRMGLHYGEPKVRGNDYWGEDVHFAARICSAAHGGQVVVSAAMRAALRDAARAHSLGHHGLKDFPTPRELFQLVPPSEEPEEFPAPRTLSTFRSNLPSISTRLIGREDVLTELAAYFAEGRRLVTLTGAGGMGKTRVAIELGERMAERYADGVAFVSLAAVDSEGVAAAVGDATGAPRGGDVEVGVLDHLKRRRMLVILDNCEHLVDAAAALATAILDHCPDVELLATAQLPLDLSVETVHRLPPLTSGSEMFVDRARARDRSFLPSPVEREQIEQLCDLLDGFPLAIELAAARVRLLGTERLLDALRRDLGALGTGGRDLPERHRTLQAALAWTLSLLTPAEHAAFVALGAFAVSWSLEEAEQLLADDLAELEAWDALTRLMDASLVVVRGDGRFAMLQRVRQHAAELLADSDSRDVVRGRHAEIVGLELRELALTMFVDYRRQLANIVDLLPEARHCLAWARTQATERRARIIGMVAPALAKTGGLALIVDDLAALPPVDEPRDYEGAAICYARGLVHAMQWSTDTDVEAGLFDRAARGFAAHGDPREEVMARYMAAAAMMFGGRRDQLPLRYDAMIAAAGRTGDDRWTAEALRNLAYDGGDGVPSTLELEDVVARFGVGAGSFCIQYAAVRAQDAAERECFGDAGAWYARALQEQPRQQLYLMLNGLKGLAVLLAQVGHDTRSAELRAGVNAIYRARTGSDHGNLSPWWAGVCAESDARLGTDALAAAQARGAALSYDELVDRALEYAQDVSSASVDERS